MTIIEEKDAFIRECMALAELRLDKEKRFNSDEASVNWKYPDGEITFKIEGSRCRLEATNKTGGLRLGRIVKQALTPFLLTHLEETIGDTLVAIYALPNEAVRTMSR